MLLLTLLSAPAAAGAPPPERGIALGLFAEDPGFSYGPLLEEIRAAGATHVSLVVPYYQHDLRSTAIYRHPRYSPPDSVVQRAARQARALGLKVLLFPILRLEYAVTPQEWRGSIRPRDPDAWWRSYGRFLLKFAAQARRLRAAGLCVGSELGTMDHRVWRWAPLLKRVRAVYRGPLLYSANWDRYPAVRIWHLVDQAGLSAYFQLIDPDERATPARLGQAWRRLRQRILAWREGVGKPLVFTELGYHSQRGTAALPWNEDANEPLGLQEQADCYQAFIDAWDGTPQLQGTYFWNWFGWGGPLSREYCPRGKPAAVAICRWYGARPGRCPLLWGMAGQIPAAP